MCDLRVPCLYAYVWIMRKLCTLRLSTELCYILHMKDRHSFFLSLPTDLQHQRLRQMSTTSALKRLADLHKMETDEMYCQMIGISAEQCNLLVIAAEGYLF